MSEAPTRLCGDAEMQEILGLADADTMAGVAAIDQALISYPGDSRLHFLKGSMLIGEKRFIAAHSALTLAVQHDPDFHLARFQLGFFELTSGEAATALATWQPLHALPPENFLRIFVDGLEHLIADRFEACIASLNSGISCNTENVPLNTDMQLIISRCEELLGQSGSASGDSDGAVSATSLLLGAKRRPS